jgi:hypothetical protein
MSWLLPRLSRQRCNPTDALLLATLAFFTVLCLLFHRRVEGSLALAVKNVIVAIAYLGLRAATRRVRSEPVTFLLRTAAVTFAFAYLFGAVDRLQLIVHGHWLDQTVIDLEARLFHTQPTVWLQRLVRPWLTEWMMFAYVIYIPLYPVVCGLLWSRHGRQVAEECFFTVGLANVACDLGFIAFPVAGPMAFMGSTYTVPLRGFVFTFFGELIRAKAHFPGGSLPSPHCAAATVLWGMTWKYHRPVAWALSPVILTLYVSTFYGRYHYLTDAVAGIILALAVLALAPRILGSRATPGVGPAPPSPRPSP